MVALVSAFTAAAPWIIKIKTPDYSDVRFKIVECQEKVVTLFVDNGGERPGVIGTIEFDNDSGTLSGELIRTNGNGGYVTGSTMIASNNAAVLTYEPKPWLPDRIQEQCGVSFTLAVHDADPERRDGEATYKSKHQRKGHTCPC